MFTRDTRSRDCEIDTDYPFLEPDLQPVRLSHYAVIVWRESQSKKCPGPALFRRATTPLVPLNVRRGFHRESDLAWVG